MVFLDSEDIRYFTAGEVIPVGHDENRTIAGGQQIERLSHQEPLVGVPSRIGSGDFVVFNVLPFASGHAFTNAKRGPEEDREQPGLEA